MAAYTGIGYTSDPVNTVQQYLASRWSSTPPADIYNDISVKLVSLGATAGQLQNFIQQYGENNYFPQNTDDFVSALTNYIQTNGSPGFNTAANRAALKSTILQSIKTSLSLENAGFDQATIAAALGDPALQPNSATFYNDVYSSAFGSFLKGFNYTKNAVDGTAPTVVAGISSVNPAFFRESFQDFFVKFATVVNPTDSSVNFQQIYEAFFGTGNPNFTAFLANYINSVLYPSSGDAGTFLPNENIGDWMKKVQESYSIALNGSAAPTTSSVGQSFKKVVIIDQVLRLIIQMIGTLQKVAAMQSDRLRLLTLQQSAYTTLITQIPVFTQGDRTVFSSWPTTGGFSVSKDEQQKARDQGNNYNQTLTETVRSKRTTVQDDAKVLQSNINQSNDSANDQASTATALLQTMSTLLGAIWK